MTTDVTSPIKQLKRLGGMFTEAKLIHKAANVNLLKNPRNIFRRESCSPTETPFEDYRANKLKEEYFGDKTEYSQKVLLHTRSPSEANFLKACSKISRNLTKLQELGDKKKSSAIQDMHSLSQISLKPRTAAENSPVSLPKLKLSSIPPKSDVRVYSPEKGLYLTSPVNSENKVQQSLYKTMRDQHNIQNMKGVSKFQSLEDFPKMYTTSTETFGTSWIDEPRLQSTSNYESAKFDIINHGHCNHAPFLQMIKENPKACNRIKSITQYSDLTSIAALKLNNVYQSVAVKSSNTFGRSNALCARQADFGKTYGPFFKLFK